MKSIVEQKPSEVEVAHISVERESTSKNLYVAVKVLEDHITEMGEERKELLKNPRENHVEKLRRDVRIEYAQENIDKANDILAIRTMEA